MSNLSEWLEPPPEIPCGRDSRCHFDCDNCILPNAYMELVGEDDEDDMWIM